MVPGDAPERSELGTLESSSRASLLNTWLYRYPLLWAAVSLIAGGEVGRRLSDPNWAILGGLPSTQLWFAWAISAVLAFLIAVLLWRKCENLWARSVTAMMVMFALGGLHAGVSLPPEPDELAKSAARKAEPIAFRAVVESAAVWRPNPNYREFDPQSQDWSTQWEVRLQQVLYGDSWTPTDTRTRLSVDGRIESLLPGDIVEVYGSFRAVYPPTNPGVFNLAKAESLRGRYVFVSADDASQIEEIGVGSGYWLARLRGQAVLGVDRLLRKWVTLDQAPLAAALVFGQREQVDWQDQQQLMATGTLHMLAISGMHVEIVAWSVLLLCGLLVKSDRVRLLCVVAVCVLYASLAGAKPPVMRAVVLVSAMEVARCFGRKARLGNLLSLAAIVLFFFRFAHMDSVGVHLSFLAVGAIGIFVVDRQANAPSKSSPLRDVLRDSLGPVGRATDLVQSWLMSMLRLSCWVWLMTSPLIWHHFHVVAPIAVVLNVVVSLPLSISLLAGIATGVLGWLSPVGYIGGLVCGGGLASIRWLVGWGEALPLGHFWLPSPPLWWTVVFYTLTLVWLAVFRRERRGVLAIVLVGWLCVGMSLFAFGPRGTFGTNSVNASVIDDHDFVLTFLDVGHGTSVIAEFPTGEVWLYDAGHLGAPERSYQEIAAALWSLPTARVDRLVLSHADSDHYNAVEGLVERFSVGSVTSTHQFWKSDDAEVQELTAALDAQRVNMNTWQAGDEGHVGEVRWKTLHPAGNSQAETDNASSLCLLLEFGGQRVLLPGDLEGSGLLDLTELPPRPCQVLMAPHHGSLTLDPTALLTWCQPQWIVVSGNHRADRNEVKDKYRVPGSELGVTFRDGALQIRISSTGDLTAWHWSASDGRVGVETQRAGSRDSSPQISSRGAWVPLAVSSADSASSD